MRTATPSKEKPCSCGPDCCCHGGNSHSGYRFWFWAGIRILIVVLLIAGAFCAGVRLGFGEFTRGYGFHDYDDRGGRGMYPHMMQDNSYRPAMRVVPPVQEIVPSMTTTSGSIQ